MAGFPDCDVRPLSLPVCLVIKPHRVARDKWSWVRGQDSQAALPKSWLCQAQGGHGRSQTLWGQVLGSGQATQGKREAGVSFSWRLVSATKWPTQPDGYVGHFVTPLADKGLWESEGRTSGCLAEKRYPNGNKALPRAEA